MRFFLLRCFPALAILTSLAAPTAILAQTVPQSSVTDTVKIPVKKEDPLDMLQMTVINIPMQLGNVDLTQESGDLWAKGKRPKANKMMQFPVTPWGAVAPLQTAEFIYEKPLLRAFEGRATSYRRRGLAEMYQRRPLYCGDAKEGEKKRIICLVDEDRDGSFDGYAVAAAQGGYSAIQATLLGPFKPLTGKIAYKRLSKENLPSWTITMSNCGKDWDRPHYSLKVEAVAQGDADFRKKVSKMLSGLDRVTAAQLQFLLRRGVVGPVCEQGDRIEQFSGVEPSRFGEGGILAEVDSFIFSIGAKKTGAPLKLEAVSRPDTLYRVEGSGLIPLAVGLTYKQRDLLTAQKFPKPFIFAKGNFISESGQKTVGEKILGFDIEHGYIGKLTKKITIRTLLNSRSLDVGTLAYGVPMKSSTRVTINGIPQSFGRPSRPDRKINTRLIWCVPVRQERKKFDKYGTQTGIDVIYSDSCIADQGGARHTILKGRTPSFMVSSFGYDADTSTNDGPVPVARAEGNFGASLTMQLRIAGIWSNVIHVKKQIYLGDELASEKLDYLSRSKGQETVMTIAGGKIIFSAPEKETPKGKKNRRLKKKNWIAEDSVMIRVEGNFEAGKLPTIRSEKRTATTSDKKEKSDEAASATTTEAN